MSKAKRGITPLWVAPFLQALRDGASIDAARKSVGMSASTVYRRRNRDGAFRAAWGAIRSIDARPAPTGGAASRDKRRTERFLAELAETSNVAAAAAAAGMDVSKVYRLRRTDPDFARRWYAALSEGYDNLEMELLQHLRGQDAGAGDTPTEGAKRKFDVATALRCLTAHRDSVAREKGRRTLADEVATIAAINAKIDAMRARAKEGEAAIRGARADVAKQVKRDG